MNRFDPILARQTADGGFSPQRNGESRVDATAWAALALRVGNLRGNALDRSLEYLAARQQPDGSLPVFAGAPRAIWPTPVAALAWAGTARFASEFEAATDYLKEARGRHSRRASDDPGSHDTSIIGWPWILETHSWVGPTSLAILALRSAGCRDHPRAKDGERMLLDRQLPDGGWNYGSVAVFGQTLRPLAESTGVSLAALAGRLDRSRVAASLAYLKAAVQKLRTPLSLGWSLLGLAAWNEAPRDSANWIEESLRSEDSMAPFGTADLSVLLMSAAALDGGAILVEPR